MTDPKNEELQADIRHTASEGDPMDTENAPATQRAVETWWDETPIPYIEGECCASGSCEVCQPHRFKEWG